jgi:membrane-associated phospholipid phosphatase
MVAKILNFRKNLNSKWNVLFQDKSFRISFFFSIFLFFFGQYVMMSAAQYNDEMFQVVTVGDIILDNIPTVNLSFLFTWGVWIILIPTAFYAVLIRPELAPWTLKTYGLFALVRAGFILLTHLGPPEGLIYLQDPSLMDVDGIFARYFFTNDLFFSGHVGNAFLGALIFKDFKFKWYCLIGSVVMAFTVLLMHVHYSIDVFGAYFITYGIYAFSDKIFHKWTDKFKRIVKKHTAIDLKPSYVAEGELAE